MLFAQARRGTHWSLRKLQEELSKDYKLKVTYSFLGAVEKGRRVPSYDLAYSLGKILGIDAERSLKAAYKSRIESDINRENGYIKETINSRNIQGLSASDITGGRDSDKC